MQDGRADEPCKQNEHIHWRDDNLRVGAVGKQLVEGHQHKRKLEHERQNHVHSNVHPLLLFNLKDPILER